MSQLDFFNPQRQFDLFDAPPPPFFAVAAAAAPLSPLFDPDARSRHEERMAELAEEEEIAEREAKAEIPEDEREDDPEDDDAPVIQPARDTLPRDELGEAIIAAGLTPNDYLLNLNGVMTPYDTELSDPWDLPSRLFRFPIETQQPCYDAEGVYHPRTIGLMHPLLADHPFVRRVEAALGLKLPVGAPNVHGYSKARTGLWWHAVDLVSAGRWRELLRTADFTTPNDIIGGVAYGLDYGPHDGPGRGKAHLSTREAREILLAIGADMPTGDDGAPTVDDALRVVDLSEFKGENGKPRRSINWVQGPGRLANTWGRIVGLERGILATDRGGHLTWTDIAKNPGGTLL